MFSFLAKGLKAVAAGKTQQSLGLQSPYTPGAIVRVGRFFYVTSGLWIIGAWYSGYVNATTDPGSGPKLVLPGKKRKNAVDRPDRSPNFASGIQHDNATAAGSPSQFVTQTPNQAGRTLVPLGPDQLGVPGTAVAGYLFTAPNGKKQMPAFNRNTYQSLLGIANSMARQFGLTITSGYRPGDPSSMHGHGLAFDMVGAMSNMKRAATWAATNPALFQEIFVHNEGSGMHLHTAFYPDAASIYNAGANRMVRPVSVR